jgi:hypothetical protein
VPDSASMRTVAAAQAANAMEEYTREDFTGVTLQPRRLSNGVGPDVCSRVCRVAGFMVAAGLQWRGQPGHRRQRILKFEGPPLLAFAILRNCAALDPLAALLLPKERKGIECPHFAGSPYLPSR